MTPPLQKAKCSQQAGKPLSAPLWHFSKLSTLAISHRKIFFERLSTAGSPEKTHFKSHRPLSACQQCSVLDARKPALRTHSKSCFGPQSILFAPSLQRAWQQALSFLIPVSLEAEVLCQDSERETERLAGWICCLSQW